MSAESWITVPITEEFIHGAVDLERNDRGLVPHRLTPGSRAQVDGPVEPKAFEDPSGVRIRLRTEAQRLVLRTHPVKVTVAGEKPGPAPVYDIWCDGVLHAQQTAEGGTRVTVDPTTGRQTHHDDGPAELVLRGLGAAETTVEIWLPYEETTTLIQLGAEAELRPAPYPEGTLKWLHHGSSISHGSEAVGASHAWPAAAGRAVPADRPVNLINLGFAGNAKLDPFTARTIRDTAADVISLKLGINVVNGASHTLRSFTPAVHGFLDTVREGQHARTPILVISPIWCGLHEHTPGPLHWYDLAEDGIHRRHFYADGDPDDVQHGMLTLQTLRTELERIVRLRMQTDPHLHLLSGLDLYGERDAAARPLPDGLHPDTETHQMLGERFAALAFSAGGIFSRS